MAQPGSTGGRLSSPDSGTRRGATIRFIPRVQTFPRVRGARTHNGWEHPRANRSSRWSETRASLGRRAQKSLRTTARRDAAAITSDDDLAFGISPGLRARLAKVGPAFGLGLRRGRVPKAYVEDGCLGGSLALHRVVTERGNRMMKRTVIASLHTVSLAEALAYLDAADGDELTAAWELARDRNALDGSSSEPDDTEIHHAFFLMRRARGLDAPSFDQLRVQLKRRMAA